MDKLRAEVEHLGERTENLRSDVRDSRTSVDLLREETSRVRRNQFVLMALCVALLLGMVGAGGLAWQNRSFLCDTTSAIATGEPTTPNGVRIRDEFRAARERNWC